MSAKYREDDCERKWQQCMRQNNGRTTIAELPVPAGQGLLLIEYETADGTFRNHYLYGEPPFDYPSYRTWIQKAGI